MTRMWMFGLTLTLILGAVGCARTEDTDDDTTEADDDDITEAVDDDTSEADDDTTDEYCPVEDYEPCDGDLAATWGFRALCPEDPEVAAEVCEHPFDNVTECSGTGNEALCDGDASGTLSFHADGTVDVDVEITLVTTWHFTDECLATVVDGFDTAEERCADLDARQGQTCTYDTSCVCVTEPLVDGTTTTVDYTLEGQDLSIGNDPPSTYCIDGDTLTMDFYAYHPISWRYWVLERE